VAKQQKPGFLSCGVQMPDFDQRNRVSETLRISAITTKLETLLFD
jgi:hypothetical protein